MQIRFIKTSERAKLPKKNHGDPRFGDAGYDLFSIEDVCIQPGESAVVPVGLKVGFVTPGYWFRIEARSGLGFKKGLQPHFGIIDNGYRGDLGIKVYNLSKEEQWIKEGTGVAQLIPYFMIPSEVTWIDEAVVSERGEKGFGSSGI